MGRVATACDDREFGRVRGARAGCSLLSAGEIFSYNRGQSPLFLSTDTFRGQIELELLDFGDKRPLGQCYWVHRTVSVLFGF